MSQAVGPADASGERREQIVRALTVHFAADRVGMEELERRLDLAHRARTSAELETALEGLPAVESTSPPAGRVAPRTERPPAPVERQQRRYAVAVMSGADRRGHWVPGEQNLAVAVMGGVSLDFREAHLPPGVTEVTVFALMGGCDIVVPPWVRVEAGGFALMGGFDAAESDPSAEADAPTLRVNGLAIMGGVEISVRLPGESARDAKRRRKAERQELADRQRRLQRGG
ncbi:MAG: DUF1707 domain-containing protein [Gemmatimonadota bacterium]